MDFKVCSQSSRYQQLKINGVVDLICPLSPGRAGDRCLLADANTVFLLERRAVASLVLQKRGTDKLPLEQRPALLEAAMLQWLTQHPEFNVRATLPITSYGHTVAIHVWFE